MSRVARRHQQAILVPQLLGEAKVNDPYGLGPVRPIGVQNIRRLQVPMDNAIPVQVVHRIQNDSQQAGRLLLRQEPLLQHLVKELAAPAQLQHQIHLRAIQEYVATPHNIRVMTVPQQNLNLIDRIPLRNVHYLDGKLGQRLLVHALVAHTECARVDLLLYHVLVLEPVRFDEAYAQ